MNVSEKNKQEIERAINQGFFEYHGLKIFLKDNIQITVERPANNFNFTQFQTTEIAHNITAAHLKSYDKIQVINTDIFDRLLIKKSIENGQYFEHPGLIEEAKNQALELFITSELSNEQWYCLLARCAKYQVQLKLFLVPGIALPKGLKFQELDTKEPKESLIQETVIHLGNSQPYDNSQLYTSNNNAEIFDVEDYTYQDLLYDIDFHATKEGFKDFTVKIKPLLQKLIDGETVVLKGEFPEKLCRCLEPILIQKKIELPTGTVSIKGKLILIVENQQQELFKWSAPQDGVIVLPKVKAEKNILPPPILVEPPSDEAAELALLTEANPEDLEKIQKNAEQFIANREQILLDALKTNSIVQLVGESGIGKSRLLLGLQAKQAAKDFVVYNELSQTKDWLENTTQDKTKILFIDEVNVEDKHLTMFNPVKSMSDRKILFEDTCLSPDIHHKLVTAKNPEEYGGGRNKQKLFADNDCLEIHLQDFPISFLYTDILRPIYEKSVKADNKISEKVFAQDCANYLKHYRRNPNLTARELQEYALRYCANQLKQKLKTPKHSYESTQKFVATESNAAARVAINNFIDIRHLQRQGHLPPGGIGLNGVLIEGTPGTGKSALIKNMLESKGYQIKSISDEQKSDKDIPTCYKIDASLSLEQKTRILLQAFHEGNAVWIDEINGCIDDGLEKLLNALLTGVDLTKNPATKPGFMMFATANGISLEGRSLISPAIKHRCLSVQLNKETEADIERILKITFANENINYALLAKHFILWRDNDKNINLRNFLKNIESNPDLVRSAYPSNTQNDTNAIDLDGQGQPEKKEMQEQRRDRNERALLAFKIYAEHALKKDETSAKDSEANKKTSSLPPTKKG